MWCKLFKRTHAWLWLLVISTSTLLAGFDALDTIVILGNQTTIDKLKKGDAKFGMDIDLIVGKDSSLAQTDSSWTETETAVGFQ